MAFWCGDGLWMKWIRTEESWFGSWRRARNWGRVWFRWCSCSRQYLSSLIFLKGQWEFSLDLKGMGLRFRNHERKNGFASSFFFLLGMKNPLTSNQ
jgi:hypothetical protein